MIVFQAALNDKQADSPEFGKNYECKPVQTPAACLGLLHQNLFSCLHIKSEWAGRGRWRNGFFVSCATRGSTPAAPQQQAYRSIDSPLSGISRDWKVAVVH